MNLDWNDLTTQDKWATVRDIARHPEIGTSDAEEIYRLIEKGRPDLFAQTSLEEVRYLLTVGQPPR